MNIRPININFKATVDQLPKVITDEKGRSARELTNEEKREITNKCSNIGTDWSEISFRTNYDENRYRYTLDILYKLVNTGTFKYGHGQFNCKPTYENIIQKIEDIEKEYNEL